MHNIFRLADTHTECQTTAISRAVGLSASIQKPGFTHSPAASRRGSCAQRSELQHIVQPDAGMPWADGYALQSYTRYHHSLLLEVVTLPYQ